MPNPERQNLVLLVDAKDQQTVTGIHINPAKFSAYALRKIALLQMNRTDFPTGIFFVSKGETTCLTADEIQKEKTHPMRHRRLFIEGTAEIMSRSDDVIIKRAT